MKKVEDRFEPKSQTRLLQNLTFDVNTLNNQFLNDTLELSNQYIDSIIGKIEANIQEIQIESEKLDFEKSQSLDTIPKMLYELKQKNFQLKEMRSSGESDFMYSLERVIQSEFKNKLLSEKDSIVVTHQITSYIKENKILSDQSEQDNDEEAEEDERNFFQRLFNTRSKSKNSASSNEQESKMDTLPQIELDTTTQQFVDTLAPQKSKESRVDLFNLFENIQSRRIDYMNTVQLVEREIYELNYSINKKIEDIINDFVIQQYATYESYLIELKNEAGNKTTILLLLIIMYTAFSIFLVFRVFKDINYNIDYQRKLKLKEALAKKETEEKQRFLNTMSHELRTPLTSIIGYVDFLKGDDKTIKAIRSASNYLYQMTNEILDMAKINLGVIEVKEEPVDLTKCLKEVKDNFVPQFENKALNYEFDIPESPLFVTTDGQRIQQILYNLIHNAIKFTPVGYVHFKMSIQERETEYHVVFRVIDSGIGMTKEDQEKVFQDFQQAGSSKSKMKGTGLGLGIVQSLVHELSGEIHLNSDENKGTTFVIAFDFAKVKESEILKLTQKEKSQADFVNAFEGRSILVVDDDVLITELYRKLLLPTAAQVEVYNCPKEALEKAKNQDFDLIIVDFKMPKMTGFNFYQILKSTKRKMPKIMVSTANTMLNETDKKQLEVFDKVVFKPIKIVDFLIQIAQLLNDEIKTKDNFNQEKLSEGANQVSESSEAQFLGSNASLLNLDNLKKYIGEEAQDLLEILEVTYEENKKSLLKLKMAIEEKSRKDIAFIVHQLTSRFAQIDSSFEIDTSELERSLNSEHAIFLITDVEELFDFWAKANDQIKSKCDDLKKELE